MLLHFFAYFILDYEVAGRGEPEVGMFAASK